MHVIVVTCSNHYHVATRYRWFGENTPGKRKSCSDIWKYVKRLKPGNPLSDEGHTHVCIAEIPEDEFGGTICNQPLRLHNRSKGTGSSWITTRALEHMAKYHKETQLSKNYEDRAGVVLEAKVTKPVKQNCRIFLMFPPLTQFSCCYSL
jgi:hypothetical protein